MKQNTNEIFSETDAERKETFKRMLAQREDTARKAREGSLLQKISIDFFSRFSRNAEAEPGKDELIIQAGWRIVYLQNPTPVVVKMAGHLSEFFERCMGVSLPIEAVSDMAAAQLPAIMLHENGGSGNDVSESFTIKALPDRIIVAGVDSSGLRSGVVRLIGLMGLRQAPFVKLGEINYMPRVAVRIVNLGSIQNDIFYGGNSVILGGYELYALSTSDAIPELAVRRNPAAIKHLMKQAELAREYDLGMYVMLYTKDKFEKNDPIFNTYPDIRGALTWKEDGPYTLCTEHPLVRKYLTESIEGLFCCIPDLDGIMIIIGGEGFYHCFMRAYGVERGHTNCDRCEPLGAERVVANLCNELAKAARKVNSQAEIIAWPYSASSVWSADLTQKEFMHLLDPGVSIMTEMEKDEIVCKPGGIEKLLWDYSIDLIGPGKRAATQLEVSKETGVPVFILSMAEMSFEVPLLPSVPVLDRWHDRAEALAGSGARGVYLWNMAPFNGLSSGEVYQYKWFSPAPSANSLLADLSERITGDVKAGKLLRMAWREASNGFAYIPSINSYYRGPHYLGPAHPFVLNPDTAIPDVFKGYYLFLMEINMESAMQPLPTYDLYPEMIFGYSGPESIPVLETYYRVVQDHLERAVAALNEAESMIPERSRVIYEAETLGIRWFYHTARTLGNIYESFRLTGKLKEWIEINPLPSPEEIEKGEKTLKRLQEIMLDEKQNALEAIPIAEKDPRIDTLHRGDHSFNSLIDMLHAKIKLIDQQVEEEIPLIEKWLRR